MPSPSVFYATGGARPRCVLAPMAGFTDAPLRCIAARHGAEAAYTEMANAIAVGERSPATMLLLETMQGEGPVFAQLYGSDPDAFARAAEVVTETGAFAGIDINCGCPAPKVGRCGAGAELLRTPRRIGEIIAATVAHTTLPVSAKMRLGTDPAHDISEDLLHMAADAGASSVAMHARYRTQGNAGEVHYARLERLAALGRLPVVGNGGVRDIPTALRMRDTGVAGIMVGWAAVGNPWLFQRIRAATAGEPIPAQPTVAEIRQVLLDHLDLALRHKRRLAERFPGTSRVDPERAVVLDFRCSMSRYLNGMRRVTDARSRLASLSTLDTAVSLANEVFAAESEVRARVGRD